MDGAHINGLLLRLFLLYMPGIIKAGKLYRAVPPLYGIKNSKGKSKYFATKMEFTKYIQSLFTNQYSLETLEGRKLVGNEASVFFLNNRDYTYDIEDYSNIFAVDPYLLEAVLFFIAPYIDIPVGSIDDISVAFAAKSSSSKAKKSTASKTTEDDDNPISSEGLNESLVPMMTGSVYSGIAYTINSKFNLNEFRKYLKKKFRFIELEEIKGVPLVKGLVNSKYQYLFLNDHFIHTCIDLITIIRNNSSMYYKLNGEVTSLYSVMKAFESMTPSGLTRYKGLGEQDPKQLGESVLRPDSDRTLIQYTIDSAKEEIETLRYIDSNMAILINQSSRINRQDIE